MNKNEQFAKLNNIEPRRNNNPQIIHKEYYPKFTDAKSILEVMMKRGKVDFEDFLSESCDGDDVLSEDIHGNRVRYFVIGVDYILNPNKLLDKAIEWCISHSVDTNDYNERFSRNLQEE